MNSPHFPSLSVKGDEHDGKERAKRCPALINMSLEDLVPQDHSLIHVYLC
jgi:hypothetical protein